MLHSDVFFSLEELYGRVEQIGFQPLAHGVNHSLDNSVEFAGPPIAQLLDDARTLTGEYPALVAQVDSLSAAMDVTLPDSLVRRRVRTWGKQGYALNPHRVLRGQLGTAWRRTKRQEKAGPHGVLTLVLPAAFNVHNQQRVVGWSLAAGLSLASMIDQSGRRCEIWAHGYGTGTLAKPRADYEWGVCLKRADEPYSVHGVAALMHRGFFRRFGFRLIEAAGRPDWTYGRSVRFAVDWHRQVTASFERWHVAAPTILFGPYVETDGIDSQARAQDWLNHAFQAWADTLHPTEEEQPA